MYSVRYIKREAHMSAGMRADNFIIDPNPAAVIDRTEMEHEPPACPIIRNIE